jgi:glycosyltransferase 2 family protein
VIISEDGPKIFKFRHVAFTTLKVAGSGAAVLWLVFTIQWDAFIDKAAGTDWLRLSIALAVFSLWIWPCALRWRQIVKSSGYPVSLGEATRGYLMGAFFSAFLPTAKGGDVVRGVLLARRRCFSIGGILATVFAERFIGLAVALFMVFLSSVLAFSRYSAFKEVFLSASALALFLFGLVLVYMNRSFRKFFSRFVHRLPLSRLQTASDDFAKVLDICFARPLLILSAVGFSFMNQLVMIVSGFLIASAIPSFDAPWISFPLVIPLNFIAVLLPSIGGYGIREASFVIFFGWFGVSEEAAVLFGMLQLLFFWVFSVVGGYCFITGKPEVKLRK